MNYDFKNNIMIETSIKRLNFLCSAIPPILKEIDEQTFSFKSSSDKWSKKEIIGHLIDSATNNHQRFVRGQFEDCPTIFYDQNKWNEYSFYQQVNGQQIIDFWTTYNKQLLEIIKHISSKDLQRTCKTNTSNEYTLNFLINDYVEHLEHHLKQIINYKCN